MRKLIFRFIVPATVLAAIALTPILKLYADSVGTEIRAQHLAGGKLRLVVETYRTWTPPLSRNSNTGDLKGYLVVVDLDFDKPLADRTQVIGPLWDVSNPQSSISYEAGVNFTQEDVDAKAATPDCAFDTDGTLLRFTLDQMRKQIVRDALIVTTSGSSWKRVGDVQPIRDVLRAGSEDRLQSTSGRYMLLYRNGKTACFDLFTGQQKEDDWLTKQFTDVRSIKDFENIRQFLTDDLRHLVVSPHSIWNKGQGEFITTFDYGGKTYNRKDFGLACTRAAERPIVFPRQMDLQAGFLAQPPHGAFPIGGELYLFENSDTALRLYTPDGKKEFVAKATPEVKWEAVPFPRIQHAVASKELALFASNDITDTARPNEVVSVIRWNYVKNKLTRDEVPIVDLFELRSGQLHPKQAIKVDAQAADK